MARQKGERVSDKDKTESSPQGPQDKKGGPVNPEQFVDINLGGAERSEAAQAALNKAVAEYNSGNNIPGMTRVNEFGYINQNAFSPQTLSPVFDRSGGSSGVRSAAVGYRDMSGLTADEFGVAADMTDYTDQEALRRSLGLDDAPNGGGRGGDPMAGLYDTYFSNQEQAVQDKFDSIKDYLDELQISSDEGFAADMDRITNMYTERADARNDRFEEALRRPELRQGAAIETLAEIGIQADPSLFDPITGATQDMLFSQQMSGADMLNTMSYITETIYDFAKNEQDLSIAAGLENAQQNLISDMAAIQMARDAQAISTAQAAQAAAKAQAESDKLMQAYITMGASIGMSPEVAMAYGQLGMLGDAYGTYTDPNNPSMTTVLGGQQVPVTVDQFIAAENLGLDQAEFAASQTPEGYATMVDGQIVVLPFNQVAPFFEAADLYGIDIQPVPLEGDGTEGS